MRYVRTLTESQRHTLENLMKHDPAPRARARAHSILLSSRRVTIKEIFAHSALRADSWNLNPCLRGRPVVRLMRRCSGLRTKQARLANRSLFGLAIIANKAGGRPTLIANEPTMYCEGLANSLYGSQRLRMEQYPGNQCC